MCVSGRHVFEHVRNAHMVANFVQLLSISIPLHIQPFRGDRVEVEVVCLMAIVCVADRIFDVTYIIGYIRLHCVPDTLCPMLISLMAVKLNFDRICTRSNSRRRQE